MEDCSGSPAWESTVRVGRRSRGDARRRCESPASGSTCSPSCRSCPTRHRNTAYPMEWDNVAALPVSTFDHWWTKQINSKTRNVVRLAEKKGVVVREVPFDDVLVRGNFSRVQRVPHPAGKTLPALWEGRADRAQGERTFLDRSIFIGAFLEEQLIGFAKLVCDEDRTQAGLMQIVSMVQHRDKAPTNALIAQAVRSCAERKIRYLVYASFAYGNKQRDSLSDFKRRNGFRRVDLPRYYLPLTVDGPGGPSPGTAPSIRHSHSRAPARAAAKSSQPMVRAAAQVAKMNALSVHEPQAMPGIVGLVTGMPRERAERELRRMVDALRHEPFYETGTWIDASLGVYVGWCARKNSFSDRHAAAQ